MSIYEMELKIVSNLLQSTLITEGFFDVELKNYVSMFFANTLLFNLNKVFGVVGDPLLTKVPERK